MSISNGSVRSGPLVPDGAAVAYPFGFLALSAGELQVTQVQGGVEAPISGWSALLNGEGGTVIFMSPPAIGSGNIYINANPALVQTVAGNAALLPGTVASALDRVTQIALLALSRTLTPAQLQPVIASAVQAYLATQPFLVADQGTGL